MFRFIILIFVVAGLNGCTQRPELWPGNNTAIEAIFYKLQIGDTSKIFNLYSKFFKLPDLPDSLIIKYDTIRYSSPDVQAEKYFKISEIKTMKTYSSNPGIAEYYVFEEGAVKLAGFRTVDTLSPVTAFSKPLVILPGEGIVVDSTTAIKKIWNIEENAFKEETRTRTKVELIKTGNLSLDGKTEEFLLYELTIVGDTKVSYGEKDLVIPDAIHLQSKLLFGKSKGLLFEWRIKMVPINPGTNDPSSQPHYENYLEVIKYILK